MFFLVTPMFLGSCFIVIAFTAVERNPSLTEAFPLQGCKNNDINLLLVTEFNLVYEFYKQRIFLSELLDYFLPPDVLRRRLKVAMAYSRLSYEAREFSFQFDNITDNDKVPTIAESPNLSFQFYNTTEDVDNQLQLFPRVSGIGLYTNDTFIDNCYKRDLLGGFALNSSHVAAVIVGNITTHAIERFQYANSHWGKACSVKMFLILVGHDVKDIFLQQIPKIETQFILPYLKDILLTDLCFTCYYGRPTNRGLTKEKSFYSMYTSDSLMTWFEASQQCKERSGQIVSVETEAELHFLTFILNNYYEEMYQEQTSDADATDDIQYFKKLYIGLIRDVSRAGSPFQWLNGSPLVSTQWLNTLPDGGPNQRCGLWLFSSTIEWPESSDGTAYNVSGLQNHNGWEDIGCGSRVTNIVLCESESFVDLFDYHIENLKALPAKTDSFINAVSQGEFKIYQNEIVSIPAFVRNSTFANFFEKTDILFRVFYCDGMDDDTDIIPYSYVCDHVDHCKFGRDENICYNKCKNSTEFQCQSGQCVPLESRCDVYTDCYDGSDEKGCQFCNSAMCCDGPCIPRHFILNGEVDCVGCSAHEGDENFDANQDLRYYDCPFICNRSECVAPFMLNDNITQCLGPEGPLDEIWGKLETVNSCKISYQVNGSSVEFVRWSPRCVYIKDRYGAVIGCRDMSHLHDCQNFTCPDGYVKCPDSYCIPFHLVGDSLKDCPNGLEERSEININCTGNFQCWGEKVCVHPDLVCDGYPHCPSGDDELNCHVSCAEGFRCIAGTVTVTGYDKSKPLHDLSFIDKRTRYLDLSGVDMSAVINVGKEEQFRHVVELYLSNCQISDLNGNTIFKFSLHGVYALDLSYNLISTLSGTMMTSMYNLHVINLSHNKLLTSIPFNMWNELKHLNLAFTAVSTVNQVVLSNFKKLEYLNLSHTHISVIDQQSLPKQLSLATLDLRGTPLSNIEPNALFSLSVSKDFYSDLYKLCCPQVRGQGIYEHVCHAPASAISSCMDLIQEPAQRVLLWTVGVLAVTGNLVVITYRLLWDRAVLKKSYGLFVTNLSVSDLFMGVYLLIIAGTDVIYRDNYVWYESDWRHSTLCQTAGFLSTLSSETSAFFILLVTIDRFLVIRFPFGHFRFTRWSMVLSCLVAWTVGFLLALIPALPRFQHWQMYSSNGMCLGLPLTPDRRSGWEYSAALFIGLNFILFLFIACGQYLIYNAMSENSLKMSSEVQSNAKRVQEIMVAKQLSLVVLSDFLCWFPIGIMGLLAISGRDIGTEVYAWSAVLVLPINSALNPVLYTVPVIMKKWEDFKQGNGKTGTKKSFRSRGSTRETSS